MKHFAASATVVAAVVGAFVLVLTGRMLLPIGADLLPIPSIVPGSPQVVVVEPPPAASDRPPAGGPRTSPTPTPADDPSSTEAAALVGGAGVPPVPAPIPVELPDLGSTQGGYVHGGHVVLSLGWADGAATTVERRLAPLAAGSCGTFGAWQRSSAADQLPLGSCAVYRVLVDGQVVYELPDVVRYDGTRPTTPELEIVEASARVYSAGSILYVQAGADDLRPVTVVARASDPESGLASMLFASGESSVTVEGGPWQVELVPVRTGITVTAVNGAGDRSTSGVDVVADGEGPSGGFVDYPAAPGLDGSVPITFDPGTDAVSGVDLSSGALERRAAILTSAGCGEYGGWSAASAGDTPSEGRCVQYRFRVRDNVGNETVYTSPVEVTVADQTAPTTAVVSPASGASLTGTVDVVAESADAGSGLRAVSIQLRDRRGGWVTLGSGSGAKVVASLDTLTVKPGSYLLRSVAEDAAGNVSESLPVKVRVAADTTAPTAAIVSPSAHGAVVSGTVTVQAQAADAESGLASVTIQVRRACGGWSDLATSSSGSVAATWDTSALEPGRYQLRAVATDRRGNTGISASVGVVVEPVVVEEPPSEPPVEEPPVEEPPAEPIASEDDVTPPVDEEPEAEEPPVTEEPPATEEPAEPVDETNELDASAADTETAD